MVDSDVAGLDVESLRGETPGVEHVLHFNNAGSSLPTRQVLETVISHLRREAEIGGYEAAAEAGDAMVAVHESAAALIGVRPDHIALTDSATRAWDMAVYGYPFRSGDRVLVARAEYASNVIALLQLRERFGIELVLIEDDAHGQVSLEHLADELEMGAVMVSLTHIPTGGGLVNPAAEVGRLCGEYGAFYVLDACQSIGQVPIDMEEIRCDVLTATGRKYLRAPRGTGFLAVGDRALERIEPQFLDLFSADWTSAEAGGGGTYAIHEGAQRFESFECSVAGRLGLGRACEYAADLGVERTWIRIRRLAEHLRSQLAGIEGVEVHDKGAVRGGIVTFAVDAVAAGVVSEQLRSQHINTSVADAAKSMYDLPERGLEELVRASVHYYNTEAEVALFCEAIQRITRALA